MLPLLLLLQLLPACPTQGWRTSAWGPRKDPITNRKKVHKGLDIGAVVGTPVHALWSGKVLRARQLRDGYGNYVVILSGEIKHLYAHLDQSFVSTGDRIKRGDLIGKVGQSGKTTGPHLHLGVWERKRSIDPDLFLGYCPDLP